MTDPPRRTARWVACVLCALSVGFIGLALACSDGKAPDPDPSDGKPTTSSNGGEEPTSPGVAGSNSGSTSENARLAAKQAQTLATVDRVRRRNEAINLMPENERDKTKLEPPDSATMIVRDLQGYSTDCGCSTVAVGGITRVAGLLPELPLPFVSAGSKTRSFVFVGRLLLPELTMAALREVEIAQAPARISVTAKILAELPGALWVADPTEVAELETEGVDWSSLKPFMHPPGEPVRIEGMEVRFVAPITPQKPSPTGNTPSGAPYTAFVGPGVPPTNPVAIELLSSPMKPDDPNPTVTRVELPHVGDRARNVIIVARWNGSQNPDQTPILDLIHGEQYKLVRQSRRHAVAGSALNRAADHRRRGIPYATQWRETILRDAHEDIWIKHVVDRAEFETGHLGIPMGKELSSMVPLIHAAWSGCNECHPKAYTAWRESKHSKAFQTLFVAKRHTDARCVGCHTQHVSLVGPLVKVEPHHQAVTCMTCHQEGKPPVNACTACHNDDTDPKGHWKKNLKTICPGDTVAPSATSSKPGHCDRSRMMPSKPTAIPPAIPGG